MGPIGLTGPTGPAGAAGQPGPTGPQGPAGLSVIQSVVQVCGGNAEGTQSSCEVHCPAGHYVLGGGGMGLGDYDEHQQINASFPITADGNAADEAVLPTGWIVWVNNERDTATSNEDTVKVWVSCARAASATQTVLG
jgi:hypothetical protein